MVDSGVIAIRDEIYAADALAIHLGDTAFKLGLALDTFFHNIDSPLTVRLIQREIVNRVFTAAGGQTSKLMANYLYKTLATPTTNQLEWAPTNQVMLQAESKLIAESVITTRTINPVRQAGSLLSSYVNDQIDRTIDKHRTQNRRVRHLTANACDWCKNQKSLYDNGAPWYRHANCNCYSVRAFL